MTARYAHIHNSTMKAAFVDYQDRLVDIQGKMNSSNDHLNARWLKQNIMTQALPNRLCSLPLTQQKCPHANVIVPAAAKRKGNPPVMVQAAEIAKHMPSGDTLKGTNISSSVISLRFIALGD